MSIVLPFQDDWLLPTDNGAGRPNEVGAAFDPETFLVEYGRHFIRIVGSGSHNMRSLQRFYSAPLYMLGRGGSIILQTDHDVFGTKGLFGEVERFRSGGFVDSALCECKVSYASHLLTVVDAIWSRTGPNVPEVRVALTYAIALLEEGWRIVTITMPD